MTKEEKAEKEKLDKKIEAIKKMLPEVVDEWEFQYSVHPEDDTVYFVTEAHQPYVDGDVLFYHNGFVEIDDIRWCSVTKDKIDADE